MNNETGSVSQLDTISETPLSESIQQLFSRLRNSDVEQFINAYQLWTLHQQIDLLDLQITLIQQEILSNAEQLHLLQPTSIELSTLAQLQSSGVSDIDLLDRMHARGEIWLDNALQLLEHCERLDMIQGNYTQWCEHALEGAYDWLSSIDEDDLSQAQPASAQTTECVASTQENDADDHPERLLLQKLFSENEETISKESWTEAETELPEEPSDISIAEQNTASEETEVEDVPEQSEAEPAEKLAIVSAPEIEIPEPETSTELTEESPLSEEPISSSAEMPEPETNTELTEETAEESSLNEETSSSSVAISEPETNTELTEEMTEESPLNKEIPSSSIEIPEEDQNTQTFTPISTNTPHGSEQAEDQEVQEISEHTANLEEQASQIEDTDDLEEQAEQAELAEEAEEETEQPHLSKRNRLINRFVGRIFPKG